MSETIDRNSNIAELLAQYPQTVPVFLGWKLDCIGCDLSTFCTLEDAARDYQVDLDALLFDIRQVVGA